MDVMRVIFLRSIIFKNTNKVFQNDVLNKLIWHGWDFQRYYTGIQN